MKTKKFILELVCVVFVLFSFNSCKDAVTPVMHDLDFSTMPSDDSVGDVGILHIEWVKLLMKDIKLNVTSTSTETNFKVGPFYVFLDMANVNNVTLMTTAQVPPGSYDRVKFEVHKLQDGEPIPDPDFADSNGKYSVVVQGRYAGTPFLYKSTKSAHQILSFPSSLYLDVGGKTNITLVMKPYIWFIKNGLYLDPNDPVNSSDIDNNIKDNINHNFKIFKDNDRNGLPD
ncbi:MAG TPA: hypothetical protein VGK25_08030 [Ignavibacteria bacterium]|jgi:hypothetical protein